MEILKEIMLFIAPVVAGFITSIAIPFVIKKFSTKSLQKKIDEISMPVQVKDMQEKLDRIEKELLEMRGKRK